MIQYYSNIEQKNPWSQYFETSELEKVIHQDLIRLYPEHPFFNQKTIQEMMLRILLIWSRENTDTSYRQGMHELLVVYCWYLTII